MNKKIEELFNTICGTKEYKDYQNIKDLLINDKEIMNLIEEIKALQQKATKEESRHKETYHEIDQITKNKIKKLNEYTLYQEFIEKKENLNEILAFVTNMISKYLENIIK